MGLIKRRRAGDARRLVLKPPRALVAHQHPLRPPRHVQPPAHRPALGRSTILLRLRSSCNNWWVQYHILDVGKPWPGPCRSRRGRRRGGAPRGAACARCRPSARASASPPAAAATGSRPAPAGSPTPGRHSFLIRGRKSALPCPSIRFDHCK